MSKYANGKYQIKNLEKYIGKKTPTYRSSWEFTFCSFCDNNPSVVNWASEAIQIPYFNPVSGKQTIFRSGSVFHGKRFCQCAKKSQGTCD